MMLKLDAKFLLQALIYNKLIVVSKIQYVPTNMNGDNFHLSV